MNTSTPVKATAHQLDMKNDHQQQQVQEQQQQNHYKDQNLIHPSINNSSTLYNSNVGELSNIEKSFPSYSTIPSITVSMSSTNVGMVPTANTNNNSSNNNSSNTNNNITGNTHQLTPDELIRLSKDLKYRDFYKKGGKTSSKGFTHFFLSQEIDTSKEYDANSNLIVKSPLLSPSKNSTAVANSLNSRASSINKKSVSTRKNAVWNLQFSHDGRYMASAGEDGSIKIYEVISSSLERTEYQNSSNNNSNNSNENNNNVNNNNSNSVSGLNIINNNGTNNNGNINLFDLNGGIEDYPFDNSSNSSGFSNNFDHNNSYTNNNNGKLNGNSIGSSRRNSNINNSNNNNSNNFHHNIHHRRHYSTSSATSSNKYGPFAPVFKPTPKRVFKHDDTVVAMDWSRNNFLLSTSQDKTVKLWHDDRQNCLRTFEVNTFVTCVKFHKFDDRFFACATWDGYIHFWSILENEIVYKSKIGQRITCIEFSPNCEEIYVGGEKGIFYVLSTKGLAILANFTIKRKKKNALPRVTDISSFKTHDDTKILVTTNDSRIRLFSYKEKKLSVRFKGYHNEYSTIKASVSESHSKVISGSEDGWCYLWDLDINSVEKLEENRIHKFPWDISSIFKDEDCLCKNKFYGSFHVHNSRCNCAIFAPRSTSKLLELSNDPIFELKNKFSFLNNDVFKKYQETELDDLSTGIIVTTDNEGLIRVFRRDCAHYTRKYINSKKLSTILDAYSNHLNPGNNNLSLTLTNATTINNRNHNNSFDSSMIRNQSPVAFGNNNGATNSNSRKSFSKIRSTLSNLNRSSSLLRRNSSMKSTSNLSFLSSSNESLDDVRGRGTHNEFIEKDRYDLLNHQRQEQQQVQAQQHHNHQGDSQDMFLHSSQSPQYHELPDRREYFPSGNSNNNNGNAPRDHSVSNSIRRSFRSSLQPFKSSRKSSDFMESPDTSKQDYPRFNHQDSIPGSNPNTSVSSSIGMHSSSLDSSNGTLNNSNNSGGGGGANDISYNRRSLFEDHNFDHRFTSPLSQLSMNDHSGSTASGIGSGNGKNGGGAPGIFEQELHQQADQNAKFLNQVGTYSTLARAGKDKKMDIDLGNETDHDNGSDGDNDNGSDRLNLHRVPTDDTIKSTIQCSRCQGENFTAKTVTESTSQKNYLAFFCDNCGKKADIN
ncbi:hypothetical protein B5S33_g2273 [[Candida] boidinii]|nr:hypothetical protein B5S33_g2273 [[Candida] boidinii]